jgi:2-oxoglutarate dehydrogenase E2 component (dihydrolipoamide succinyltransferase)
MKRWKDKHAMVTVVTMPQLGESVVEGTVARWLKAPGDPVDKFEPLLEIATDKIDTEIPAPASGTLLAIIAQEGETVAVGGVLAHIGEPGEAVDGRPVDGETVDGGTVDGGAAKPTGREFVSPVVARMVREHGVDLNAVTGTGLGGRVTKKDLLAHLETEASTSSTTGSAGSASTGSASTGSASAGSAAAVSPDHSPMTNDQGPGSEDETLHPLSTMRRAIAQHLVLSKQISPHVTTVYEVDATAIVRHREANRQLFAEKGITLTYTPYFVAAVAAGLRAVPLANSRFTEAGLVMNRRIHIGVAVALPAGLIVPVIHDADEKNLQGLARAVNELATAARNGQLTPEATRGGTFTVTNHGVTGSLLGTPIINQPQSAILGIGTISKRVVVRSASPSLLPDADDAIVIRPMCYLSLSFDHRVLDGATADEFLAVVRATLENY